MVDFTIVRKGFDTKEVDTYIVSLESELQKKETRLNEYRSKESAINQAVIEAQLIADSIVSKAREEAAQLKSEAAAELVGLRQQILALRSNLSEFQESYNRLLSRYIFQSHCEDMNRIYDRLETLMNKMELDPDKMAAMPPVIDQPQDPTELSLGAIRTHEPETEANRIKTALRSGSMLS